MNKDKKNKVLMIALDFPPCQSAGVQRTLKFCEQLPDYGWQPFVLSAKSFIYNQIEKNTKIPEWLEKNTFRAFGFNSVKHFSIKGKYFLFTALPDSYITWYWHSVVIGKKIIKQQNPKLIWSTHPCLTTLKIAASLKKYSGLPWIADFRDPFKGHYELSKDENISGNKIDYETVHSADLLVFATKNMAELYKVKYPDVNASKFVVIENGYNEEVFSAIESKLSKNECFSDESEEFCLLHSGAIYDGGRDPCSLLNAVKIYNSALGPHETKVKIVFRGAECNEKIKNTISSLNINDSVQFLPSINYAESITEMLSVDALIVIQGACFNNQIPGKVYEYIRANKTILAIVDKNGATADLLKDIDHAFVVDVDDEKGIVNALALIQTTNIANEFNYTIYDRRNRSKELAGYLDSCYENNG
ncbi:MAG: hypothetical protein QM504_08625 [Pseudomonadota bacterium]